MNLANTFNNLNPIPTPAPTPAPTLNDHANTLIQMGLQQPMGTPDRYQMIGTGLKLAQLHNQNQQNIVQQNPADGYMVQARNGNTYAFPTSDAAAQFKAQYGVQQDQPTNQGTGGILGGIVGAVKGIGQEFNAATNPLISTLSNALGANPDVTAQTEAERNQQFEPQGTAEQIGAGASKLATAVGVGELAPMLAPEIGAATGLGAYGSNIAAQGALQGGLGFATTNGSLGQRTEQGLLQGALGAAGEAIVPPAISALKSAVSSTFGTAGEKAAVNAAYDTIDQATKYYQGIGERMVNTIDSLPQNVTASMSGQGELLQRLSEVPNLNVDFNPNAVTASDVRNISSQLNFIAQNSTEKAAPAIEGLNREFRSWATQALDAANPELKVGTQLTDAYAQAAKEYQGMKSVSDFFSPNKTPTAQDAEGLLSYVRKQMASPTGKLAMQKAIQDWASTTGIDLTNNVKTMAYVNTLKPAAKTAFLGLLKYIGVPALGIEAYKHF